MNLSRINIVARQRTPWEALDLGIILARKWYRPLMLGWLLPSAFIFIVVSAIFYESLWIGITVTWWLKPIWDRVPLYMASRALFGEEVSLKDALRAFSGLSIKEWFSWLTWRRLSTTRSFDMPVTILEGLKGSERRKRLNTLHIQSSSAATWLTIICVHIEMALMFGAVGLFFLFIPEEFDVNLFEVMASEEYLATLIYNIIAFIAMALVAPFYTMAGFALYISRRISLEGWDIEIRFRHLASRQSDDSVANDRGHKIRANRAGVLQMVAIALLVPTVLLISPDSHAREVSKEAVEKVDISSEGKAARQDIDAVLNGGDFNQKETLKKWRFKNSKEMADSDEAPDWLIRFIEFLEGLRSDDADSNKNEQGNGLALLIAKGLEFILWVAGISLLLFLIYYYREYILGLASGLKMPEKKVINKPVVLFGLDVRKESIPDDVTEKVLQKWREGMTREALGLLYRATLSQLIHKYSFEFMDSATEMECANIVNGSDEAELKNYFQGLTRIWQRMAYGHQAPDEHEVIILCESWPGIFAREN